MKHLKFRLLLVLGIASASIAEFMSCKQQNTSCWHICGNIQSDNATDTLYLLTDADRDTIGILIATQGKLAAIEGTTHKQEYCRLQKQGERRLIRGGFFLDYADIELQIDTINGLTVMAEGGEMNSVFNDFRQDIKHVRLDAEKDLTIEGEIAKRKRIYESLKAVVSRYADQHIAEQSLTLVASILNSNQFMEIFEMLSPTLQQSRQLQSDYEEMVYRKGSEMGDTLKNLEGLDDQGNSIRVYDLIGKESRIVLLDFWGLSCGPCIKMLPHIQQLYDKYKDRGLNVIGVAGGFGHNLERENELLKKSQITYPQIHNVKYMTNYGIYDIPCLMLITNDGIIVSPHNLPLETLEAELDRVLGS